MGMAKIPTRTSWAKVTWQRKMKTISEDKWLILLLLKFKIK